MGTAGVVYDNSFSTVFIQAKTYFHTAAKPILLTRGVAARDALHAKSVEEISVDAKIYVGEFESLMRGIIGATNFHTLRVHQIQFRLGRFPGPR